MTSDFKKQAMETLSGKAVRGEISRRQFTQLAAMLLAGTPVAAALARGAFAQSKELVLVNWGGDAITAYDEAYGEAVHEGDRHHRQEGRLRPDRRRHRRAVQERQARPGTWSTSIPFSAITLGKQGMLEPIDYTIVDKTKMRPGFGWEYAASTYFFSYVIAYDS